MVGKRRGAEREGGERETFRKTGGAASVLCGKFFFDAVARLTAGNAHGFRPWAKF
jgi:hypothetical protein